MESTKQVLTHSSLKTFRQCKKKYFFQYEQGIETVKESEPLFFGSLMHEGIAVYSKNHSVQDAIDVMTNIVNETTQDEFVLAKAIAMMEGYATQYNNEPYLYVEIEKEYRAPLLNPETARSSQTFELAGKIDAIVKCETDRFMIKEIKTTSESIDAESPYWQRLMMDAQISNYFIGAEVLGYKINSCVYDVLKKPTLTPYKATPIEKRQFKKDGTLYASQRDKDETPQEYYERLASDIKENPSKYYARKEIARSENDLKDFLTDVWDEAQILKEKKRNGIFSRNTEACITVYGTCPFWSACVGAASIDDHTLYRKKGSKHTELAEAI